MSNVFLADIESARYSHRQWLYRTQRLIENMPITDAMIALDPTKSEFGIWLYSKGVRYQEFAGYAPTVENIVIHNEKLHEIYLNIYKIYFVDSKRSWILSKLVAPHKKVSTKQQKEAYIHFEKLEFISALLLKDLDILYRSVQRIDVKTLQRVIC